MSDSMVAGVERATTADLASRRVLAFTDYYLPGANGGGSVRSLCNLTELLHGSVSFRIVTRDHDIGSGERYPEVGDDWTRCGKALVRYLGPAARRWRALKRLVSATPHDVLYLNSAFSPAFTLPLLALRRAGWLRGAVIVAPRGELAPGALAVKRRRKRLFLSLARRVGLYRGVCWHATAEIEAEDIRREFGRDARINLAEDVAVAMASPPERDEPKQAGRLRLVFLSRISPKKNLLEGIQMLAPVVGDVELDVYGPVEDAEYWKRCTEAATALSVVRMHYRGNVEHAQVGPVLSRYDAFFFPTLGENFGHVVAEALQAGCPVLISDRTPWRELAARQAGWDLPLSRPDLFRDAISRLAAMNETEHAIWRRGARELGRASIAGRAQIDASIRLFDAATHGCCAPAGTFSTPRTSIAR